MGWACAVLLVLTALVHSVAGERYLIAPILHRRRDPVADHRLGRLVLRFGWHMMSVAFVVVAVVLILLVVHEGAAAAPAFLVVGGVFVIVGLADAVISHGRHIGWPLLFLTGVTGLVQGWP